MKIFKVTYWDKDLGCLLSWHSSHAGAKKWLRDKQRERDGAPTGPEGVEEIDFPTKKDELLAWLNSNVESDNG